MVNCRCQMSESWENTQSCRRTLSFSLFVENDDDDDDDDDEIAYFTVR